MSNRIKLSLVVLSIATGFSATCVFVASRRHLQRQTTAMGLIRNLDNIDQQLSQASFEFGLALDQSLKSAAAAGTDSVDSGAVRQAHRTLLAAVNQSIAVVSQLTAPASEHGAALISAQRRFLLVQRGIIREDFGRLLGLLDDGSLPASQRGASIQAIIDAAYTRTETEFAAVHAARERFASEFAIHVTAR